MSSLSLSSFPSVVSIREATLRFNIQVEMIGGLPVAVINRAQTARLMTNLSAARRGYNRPALVFTSANGHVLSVCANDTRLRNLFLDADLILADGMPLVFASRWLGRKPLPERVATTDLFHDVAKIAQERGTTFYMLGATDQIIAQAVRNVSQLYPRLQIVGHRNGYFGSAEEPAIVEEINAARPDILWIGIGAQAEQAFAVRNRDRLRNVGIIKTAGGLFDFLSGRNRRAPNWIQAAGFEWAFRTALEPRRLGRRYLMTNPHALFLLLTQTHRPNALVYRAAKHGMD